MAYDDEDNFGDDDVGSNNPNSYANKRKQSQRERDEQAELNKKIQEELEEKQLQDEVNSDIILYCNSCGFLIDGTTADKRKKFILELRKKNPKKYSSIHNVSEIKTCPKCNHKLEKIDKNKKRKIELKNKLKELAKQEKEREELEKKNVELTCEEINEATLDVLDTIMYGFEIGKIDAKKATEMFFNKAFDILTYYRKRNHCTLSNHFILGFRKDILDYNDELMYEFEDFDAKNIIAPWKAYQKSEADYIINKELKKQEYELSAGKTRRKMDKDIDKGFRENLKRETK